MEKKRFGVSVIQTENTGCLKQEKRYNTVTFISLLSYQKYLVCYAPTVAKSYFLFGVDNLLMFFFYFPPLLLSPYSSTSFRLFIVQPKCSISSWCTFFTVLHRLSDNESERKRKRETETRTNTHTHTHRTSPEILWVTPILLASFYHILANGSPVAQH